MSDSSESRAQRRGRRSGNPIATGLALLTTVLVLVLPLPAGSNRDWAVHAMAQASLLLTALAALAVLAGRLPVRFDRLQWGAVVVWLLWLTWIGVQLLSLPPEWLQQVAPAAYAVHAIAADWTGLPALQSISINPKATTAHLLESAAYFCLFLLVMLCVNDARTRRWLIYGLIIGAVLQSSWGVLMSVSGLELGPFGRKSDYLGSATGTFINRNHFAGYLQIGGSLAVGLLLAHIAASNAIRNWRDALRAGINIVLGHAPLLRIGLLIIVVGLVASRSRMGNIAFFTAISIGGVLFILRNGGNPLRGLAFLALVLAVDLFIVGSYVGLDELQERLQPETLLADQRLATFPDLQRMIERYTPFGAGLGSFTAAYAEFRSPAVFAFNEHAHNDLAQFLIETGWPGVSLLGLLVMLVLFRAVRVMRNKRDPQVLGIALGTSLAILSIGLHSLTDFNLQIPANAATIVALLALTLSLPHQSRRSSSEDTSTEASDPASAPDARGRGGSRVRRRRRVSSSRTTRHH